MTATIIAASDRVSSSGETRAQRRRREQQQYRISRIDRRKKDPHKPQPRKEPETEEDAEAFAIMADSQAEGAMRRYGFRSERFADIVSLTWETCRRTGNTWVYAMFRSRQQLRRRDIFGQSSHDMTTQTIGLKRKHPKRVPLRADVRDSVHNPAHIVAVRLDVAEWFQHLSERQKFIITRLAAGDTQLQVAGALGVSDSLVDSERKAMRRSWLHFVSLAEGVAR